MLYRVVRSHLLRKADPYYEYGLERERIKPKLPIKVKPDRNEIRQIEKVFPKSDHYLNLKSKNALEYYQTDSGYQAINNHLREPSFNSKHRDQLIENLNSGFTDDVGEDIVVYRGISFTADHPVFKRMQEVRALVFSQSYDKHRFTLAPNRFELMKGFTFTDPGFTSTSLSQKIALNFAFPSPLAPSMLFEIHVPYSQKAVFLPNAQFFDEQRQQTSQIPPRFDIGNEHELLLPKGTTFKVVSLTALRTTYNFLREPCVVMKARLETVEH